MAVFMIMQHPKYPHDHLKIDIFHAVEVKNSLFHPKSICDQENAHSSVQEYPVRRQFKRSFIFHPNVHYGTMRRLENIFIAFSLETFENHSCIHSSRGRCSHSRWTYPTDRSSEYGLLGRDKNLQLSCGKL
jgi:hypothetical protein